MTIKEILDYGSESQRIEVKRSMDWDELMPKAIKSVIGLQTHMVDPC